MRQNNDFGAQVGRFLIFLTLVVVCVVIAFGVPHECLRLFVFLGSLYFLTRVFLRIEISIADEVRGER